MPVSCVLHERKYTWHFICPAHIIWDCGKEFKTGREVSAKAPNAWSLWLLLHASKALLLSLFFQTSELYVKYPPNWGYMAQVSAKLPTKWEVRMKTIDKKKGVTKLVFSPKSVLILWTDAWFYALSEYDPANLLNWWFHAFSEYDPANFLNWYLVSWNVTQIFSF
jgi:hypothetical protein